MLKEWDNKRFNREYWGKIGDGRKQKEQKEEEY